MAKGLEMRTGSSYCEGKREKKSERERQRGQIIFVMSHSNDLRDARCALDIFVPCAI